MSDENIRVDLTEKEMQAIVRSMAAFFNVMTREKGNVSPETGILLISALEKMKAACSRGILLLGDV